jgi:phage portal protein BeeE
VFLQLRRWLGLESRALDYGDPALQRLSGTGHGTSSGEPVSLECAAGLTTMWACVVLIAGTISSMPLILYRKTEDDGREKAVADPLFDVLRLRPNSVQSVISFWEAMVTALLLRGNAYASIVRDDEGRVRALFYLNPERVSVEVTRTGRLRYRVGTGGATQIVNAEGMLHMPGPCLMMGIRGALRHRDIPRDARIRARAGAIRRGVLRECGHAAGRAHGARPDQ